jgi:hypothetical protein
VLIGLPFDPLAQYHYTGWLATEKSMHRGIGVNTPQGMRHISLAETNDVLEHFAEHANRYKSIGPRELDILAGLRIGVKKEDWLAWTERQLSPTPLWDLPSDLYRYQIEGKNLR